MSAVGAPRRAPGRPGRRPGHSGSREAIAAAARRLFAERGYDAVTVRTIAADAGVDPALVLHFFGSKRGLFDELIRLPFDPEKVLPELLRPGVDGLGHRLASFVVNQLRAAETPDVLVALLRTAAAQPEAATQLREHYIHRLLDPVAAAVDVDQPELRAALCSSQLVGLAMAGFVIGVPALHDAAGDTLIAIYGDTLQRYLTGPLPQEIAR